MDRPNGYEAVLTKLEEVLAQLVKMEQRRDRLGQKIRKSELEATNLRKTLELLDVPAHEIPASAPKVATKSTIGSSPRTRVIDAIRDVFPEGDEMTTADLIAALTVRDDVQLQSTSPGSTISVTLRRAGEEFVRLAPGLYRRRAAEPDVDDDDRSPPPDDPMDRAGGGRTRGELTMIDPAM